MPDVKFFEAPQQVAEAFARDLADLIQQLADRDKINIALSGGSTPKLLYVILAEQYRDSIDWSKLNLFWGDDRCVEPDSPESNAGVAIELLLSKVSLSEDQIHRIDGLADPVAEAQRYGEVIASHLPANAEGRPVFDLVILGMGDDGHTASIFPHQSELLQAESICVPASHPETGQNRISLSGPILNAADRVAFLVTGANKADILAKVVQRTGNFADYPAAHVQAKEVAWYLDQAAAENLPT